MHGARIRVIAESGGDPLDQLLARFESLELAMCAPPERAAVIVVRLFEASALDSPRFALRPDARPLFFNGGLQAYAQGSDVLLTLMDGPSRARLVVPSEREAVVIEAAFARSCAVGSASDDVLAQVALVLALRHAGLFHLHAAGAISPGGAGIVIAGASGSGKTSVVLSLLDAGFDFLGDDSLLLRAEPPDHAATSRARPRVIAGAMPRPFHLGDATLAAWPRLSRFVGAAYGATGKRELDANAAFSGRLRPAMRAPGLLLFPRVSSEARTSSSPLTQGDAMAELIGASAMLAIEGVGRVLEHVELLAALAASAKAFELALGGDALSERRRVTADIVADLLANLA